MVRLRGLFAWLGLLLGGVLGVHAMLPGAAAAKRDAAIGGDQGGQVETPWQALVARVAPYPGTKLQPMGRALRQDGAMRALARGHTADSASDVLSFYQQDWRSAGLLVRRTGVSVHGVSPGDGWLRTVLVEEAARQTTFVQSVRRVGSVPGASKSVGVTAIGSGGRAFVSVPSFCEVSTDLGATDALPTGEVVGQALLGLACRGYPREVLAHFDTELAGWRRRRSPLFGNSGGQRRGMELVLYEQAGGGGRVQVLVQNLSALAAPPHTVVLIASQGDY